MCEDCCLPAFWRVADAASLGAHSSASSASLQCSSVSKEAGGGSSAMYPLTALQQYAYNSSVVQDVLSEISVMHAVQHKAYTSPYNYPAFLM
jgi:hypothetical protein